MGRVENDENSVSHSRTIGTLFMHEMRDALLPWEILYIIGSGGRGSESKASEERTEPQPSGLTRPSRLTASLEVEFTSDNPNLESSYEKDKKPSDSQPANGKDVRDNSTGDRLRERNR